MSSFAKRQSLKLFIPARDARHRTACLSLYRALLRSTPPITLTLPSSVLEAWQPLRDPLKHLIRRAFRRNLADTSPRLVYPALAAGYSALATLRNAGAAPPLPSSDDSEQKATTAEDARTSILRLLESHQLERRRTLTAKETHAPHSRNPAQSSGPREGTLPLLVRVLPPPSPPSPSPTSYSFSSPSSSSISSFHQQQPPPPPEYTTPHRPLPLSALGGTGRRKVPHLEMAGDFVFLRTTKPQPAQLSRVLTQKIRRRTARIEGVHALYEERIPEAELEDMWEESVGELLLLGERGRDFVFEGRERWGEEEGEGEEWGGEYGGWDKGRGKGKGKGRGNGREKTKARRNARAAVENRMDREDTYRYALWWHGVVHAQEALSREREDQVARAAALRDLILKEKEMAEMEKAERDTERRRRWEERMRQDTTGFGDESRASF